MSRCIAWLTISAPMSLVSSTWISTGRQRMPPAALISAAASSRPFLNSMPSAAAKPDIGNADPTGIGVAAALAVLLMSARKAIPAAPAPIPESTERRFTIGITLSNATTGDRPDSKKRSRGNYRCRPGRETACLARPAIDCDLSDDRFRDGGARTEGAFSHMLLRHGQVRGRGGLWRCRCGGLHGHHGGAPAPHP